MASPATSSTSRPHWRRVVALVSAALLLYSVPSLSPTWYVPVNLGATTVLLLAAARSGLTTADLGLERHHLRSGWKWGVAVAAVAAVGLAIAAVLPFVRPLLDDARVEGIGPGLLAYRTLIRIPLGTALLEEVAFRGVLFAAWRRLSDVRSAVVGSSLVFGVWHIRPVLDLLAENDLAADAGWKALAVLGGVVATAAAGVLLCWLRMRSRSLLAPLLGHAAVNSLATAAAFVV